MKPKEKKPRYKDVYKVTGAGIFGFFEEHRFLSNYHECEIIYDGIIYGSTESAYQSAKFPISLRKQFTNISPKDAKALGSKLRMGKEEVEKWDQKRLDVMREICEYKFFNHPELAQRLLETGDKYLEETNTWNDCFYGVSHGYGENHLGKILMDIRTKLKKEEKC